MRFHKMTQRLIPNVHGWAPMLPNKSTRRTTLPQTYQTKRQYGQEKGKTMFFAPPYPLPHFHLPLLLPLLPSLPPHPSSFRSRHLLPPNSLPPTPPLSLRVPPTVTPQRSTARASTVALGIRGTGCTQLSLLKHGSTRPWCRTARLVPAFLRCPHDALTLTPLRPTCPRVFSLLFVRRTGPRCSYVADIYVPGIDCLTPLFHQICCLVPRGHRDSRPRTTCSSRLYVVIVVVSSVLVDSLFSLDLVNARVRRRLRTCVCLRGFYRTSHSYESGHATRCFCIPTHGDIPGEFLIFST